MATPATTHSLSNWQRRTVETVVSLLAFAIWGQLAYIGGVRLFWRMNGGELGGSIWFDLASFVIGVSGSVAGVAAVWALGMRLIGKMPSSIVGAPDDSPEDYPQARRASGAP